MEFSHCNRLIRYNRMQGCLNWPELGITDWEKSEEKCFEFILKCYFLVYFIKVQHFSSFL